MMRTLYTHRLTRYLLLVALVLLATLSVTPEAQAEPGQIFYVAAGGSDENPGSEAQPWATITKAAQTLSAGQTVLVKNGTYGGVYINRSGAPGQSITFKAFPGDTPKIDITEINSTGFTLEGASYIVIDGFDLDYKVPNPESYNGERWESGILIKENNQGESPVRSHHIIISNNRIHGFPGGGVGSVLADYITIEGNTIWETAFWSYFQGSGISLYQNVDVDAEPGFHNFIRGNTVFKNENKVPGTGIGQDVITDGNCIIIDDGRLTQKFLEDKTPYPAYQSSTLIENNICAGNGGRGVHIFASDNVVVRHNTLYQNLQTPDIGGGELTAIAASNVTFVNNIVYAAPGQAATATYDGDDPNYTVSNIVFENNLYFNASEISNSSPSDLLGDPLFEAPSTDIATANFKLKPSSPAIDAANLDQSPDVDAGGIARPQGNGADIGAWESY